MADDQERKDRAMERLRAAAAAVREHPTQREELADAIVEALNAGWRPSNVEAEVPYDRNHVRRIARDRGVAPLRESTVVSRRQVEDDDE